ncbi:unnamed protein product [Parascedosporium putredinis]|uniref:Histidinol-phosphatase n=1 Tax=Parascedosporium putredinis TaxID=1442378 RepID=A0A9P1GU04_9PEZI|nr:unnamed protein product [Parascedosporium putredinis]CAI7987622.1 unnamed protein product [Parascedosporium putredinis]
MHSHSGQFCPGHAKDTLEEVIQLAVAAGFKTIGLTEHMPRYAKEDLYPEELKTDPEVSSPSFPLHQAYLVEASRLQAKYASQIHILIAFEGEFIRPSYGPAILSLADPLVYPQVDYFIGSLHHVGGLPIDYDRDTYLRARSSYVASLASADPNPDPARDPEDLFHERYYDEQHDMLLALRPRVVGHFDLIRLLSDDPARDPSLRPGIWSRILRNLRVAVQAGAWLECNTSALRKGLAEPYPAAPVARAYLEMGGRFTFSDDSHGIAQIATNYPRGLDYLESLGVTEVWTLERSPHPGVAAAAADSEAAPVGAKAELKEKSVPLSLGGANRSVDVGVKAGRFDRFIGVGVAATLGGKIGPARSSA